MKGTDPVGDPRGQPVPMGHGPFGPVSLPREMVLASAGSGKTYHLSSRLIGLLGLGVPPESVWASTFTRKAAAEILDRVLLRLARGALDEGAARELADSAWPADGEAPPRGFLVREHCAALLADLVRTLHRTNISTLDSFFVQVASTFAEALGLPPGWRLVEQGPREDLMRSEALEAVLGEGRSTVLAELLRIMAREEVGRGVHGHLLDRVESLLAVDRDVDPGVPDPWTPVLAGVGPDDSAIEKEGNRLRESLAKALAAYPPPPTRSGGPNARWAGELVRLADAVRAGDWDAFFGKGIGKKLVESGRLVPPGEVEFYRESPDAALAAILEGALGLARADRGRILVQQGRALGRMAALYRAAFEEAQTREGGLRFGDITHLLREAAVLGMSEALYFHLDARIQHVLLDEFQDTSIPQWDVMAPLVREILAGGEGERAAVLVADPKQSIYGWRGAQPGLVDQVRDHFGLTRGRLSRSYRSGPAVLNSVKAVFQGLSENPVIQEISGGPEVAGRWMKDFYPQEASDPGKPGYVQVVVGPEMDGRGTVQPGILGAAAHLVGRLREEAPGASIGVLVRTNRVVSYLIASLRSRGIPASGEGGTPLTDTAPVNALLALLRMADHPGDKLARYHVAHTPVGEVVGYANHQAGAEANRLARAIRGRLMREGYGPTLDAWVRTLDPSCNLLERARLLQLVELGFRWDGERTLRPGDFVRFVSSQRVEDPSGAPVRVMTVHQSKGLQFDQVVLPHLYDSLEERGGREPVVPLRDAETGRVVRVFPAVDRSTRALFPEIMEAHDQARALRLRDELSTLYVAMTRARYALHLMVPADGERSPGKSKSPARLFREALAPGEPADTEGAVLFQDGNGAWFRELAEEDLSGGPAVVPGAGAVSGAPEEGAGGGGEQAVPGLPPAGAPGGPALLRPVSGARTRNLPRRSPSSLEGGDRIDLGALLRMDPTGEARLRGTVVHAWCEAVEWVEDGLPDDPALAALALLHGPGLARPRLEEWISDFRRWMEAPSIRGALSRGAYPSGMTLRVERELPFLHRTPEGILQGFVDRLVVLERGDEVVAAEVLDFKTDLLDPEDGEAVARKVEYYRPQIDAYRQAVGGRYRLDPSEIRGRLLFLRAGLAREV